MEENAKNIDDVLTALLSMGFELEDSQAAVQSGRLTVESAVEWLLTQKNRPANTCRLYEADPSLSTAPPLVAADPSPPTTGSQDGGEAGSKTPTDKPDDSDDENVISRRFVNTKQRELKEKFEEKQRNEAQRLAILERKQKKSARAQVLQKIADDREEQKQQQQRASTSTVGASATVQPAASPTASSAPATTSTAEEGEQSSPTSVMCNMQIRHPDGKSLRHTFDGSTLLQEIWTYATANFTDTENMCLMQPFPRRDFTNEDASKSLIELGLCPSVGLVLKKTDGSQQAFGFQATDDPAFSTCQHD